MFLIFDSFFFLICFLTLGLALEDLQAWPFGAF